MEATGVEMHHTGGPPLGRVTVLKALVPCEVKMFGEHPLGLVVGKRSKGGGLSAVALLGEKLREGSFSRDPLRRCSDLLTA